MGDVTIIAELGLNHNGDYVRAMHMISSAKDAGVKIVKFQHYDALKLLGPNSPYLAYASRCQFTKQEHEELAVYCKQIGMEYLVSVFDINDVPWADHLCTRHKVASRMNSNIPFVNALLKTGKQVIMSVPIANPPPCEGIDYMFCITKYPTPVSDMQKLPCHKTLGLSSHCPSIAPTLEAVKQGATLIEHHVTFSRNTDGCDHSSSITFDELKQLNLWANQLTIV